MAYTQYFGSKPVSDWQANGPAESGHNFIDQINEQRDVISGKQGEYNTQTGQVGNAQNSYDEAYKNQQGYGDLYKQAKGEEGVDDAKAQYQKSLASVNATQSAMNNLPSSINAGSNVVLNASQRNAALGNQMSKFQNTLDYQTRQNAGDLSQYQTALGAAQSLAGNLRQDEVTNVNQAMTNLQTQMDYANKLYDQLLQERQLMRSIYGDMYEDEYKHMQQELEAWAQNLQAETSRYAQDQETARNNARIAADKYIADAGNRYQEYMMKSQEEANKQAARQNDIDKINQIYAQYTGEIKDLTKDKDNFFSYLWGDNSLFASPKYGFQTAAAKGRELQNKGFEDYLYQQSPYLQKILRENYSDLLGTYGING